MMTFDNTWMLYWDLEIRDDTRARHDAPVAPGCGSL